MNEKIRLLAEQAGLRFTMLTCNPMIPVVDGRQTDLQKFAELIINQCLDIVIDSDPNPKMVLDEPYRNIMHNIEYYWYNKTGADNEQISN